MLKDTAHKSVMEPAIPARYYRYRPELDQTATSCTFIITVKDDKVPTQYHRDSGNLPWYYIVRGNGDDKAYVRKTDIPIEVVEFLGGVSPFSVGVFQGHIHNRSSTPKDAILVRQLHRRRTTEKCPSPKETPCEVKSDDGKNVDGHPYWILKPLLIGATILLGLGMARIYLRR